MALAAGLAVHAFPGNISWIVAAAALTAGILLLRVTGLRFSPIFIPLVLLIGWGYGHLVRLDALSNRLPQCSDVSFRKFQILIASVPVTAVRGSGRGVDARFQALVSDVAADDGCSGLDGTRVRLTWYDAPELARGDSWSVEGKLRPPWSYQNPGGFDYERWLLGAGLNGTGYLRSGEKLASGKPRMAESWRKSVRDWLAEQKLTHQGLMLALLTGDDAGLSDEHWQWLRDSGTVHLMVISGLHVGLLSAMLFASGTLLARLSRPLIANFSAVSTAGWLAVTGAGMYVLASGGNVPAVRAWLMSALVLLGATSALRMSALNVYLVVLCVVLASDPLVVHQQGFWLSFGAVAALIYHFSGWMAVNGRNTHVSRWLKLPLTLIRTQAVLLVGLTPMLAVLQGAVPVASPIANLLVVPIVTFLLLPVLLILGVAMFFWVELAVPIAGLADSLFDLVIQVVRWGASFPVLFSRTPDALISAALGITVVNLLGGVRARWWPGLVAAMFTWLPLADGDLQFGEFRLTALDVGQGSALIVDTQGHRLLFDAGPKYPGGFDLGAAAVIPSLARTGMPVLDALILSHDDVDHSGGAEAVRQATSPDEVWTSFRPKPRLEPVSACGQGINWRWDGVSFEFLHPGRRKFPQDNDNSCVLLITGHGALVTSRGALATGRGAAGVRRALISGDVSTRVERRLAKRGLPGVDLVMAPHHGSGTSSSKVFVEALTPETVFVSAPRRSRYGHPNRDVVARYQAAGARVYVTGQSGALTWRSRDGKVTQSRGRNSAYWINRGEVSQP